MARSSTDAPDSHSDSPDGGKPGTSSGSGQQPPGLSQSFAGPAAGKGTGMLPDAMDAMTEHLKQSGERLSATASKLRSQTVSAEAYGLVGTGVSGKTNESITNAADTTQSAADGAKDAGAAVKAAKETTQLHDDKSAGKLREIDPDTDVRPHPSEPASTGPQGHREDPPAKKVSDNERFEVGANGKAYADKATIDRYADELSRKSRITLEAGKELPGTSKHEIRPVFKSKDDVPPNLNHRYEPIAGESEQQRGEKLREFHKSLDDSMSDIMKKQLEVHSSFQDEKGKLFANPEKAVADKHGTEVLNLAREKMGPAWMSEKHPHVFTGNPLTEGQYQKLFAEMSQDHGAALDAERRATADELRMTMPNDCKQGASQLTGQDPADMSTVKADPDVGQNYYKDLKGIDGGWGNHYATVVAKDGNSDLAFETAADVTRQREESKSYGYFELYQRDGEGGRGSFDQVIGDKNEEYKERKSAFFDKQR